MSEIIVAPALGLVENVHVYDLCESIKASKYPMAVDRNKLTEDITKTTLFLASTPVGAGDDNFLNGIRVAFDLTFSNKAWVEAERYHFFDFTSSQSTMHRIVRFDVKKQCNEYVDSQIVSILEKKIRTYQSLCEQRDKLNPNSIEFKQFNDLVVDSYLRILYNVPSGFKLTARMTTNYRQLKTIYYQRRNHRLPEWRAFCQWMIDCLPHFKEFLEGKYESN